MGVDVRSKFSASHAGFDDVDEDRFDAAGLSKVSLADTLRLLPVLAPRRLVVVNGADQRGAKQITEALGADGYFAHPYQSWERGLNENHNGLIRQYLPKGMALDQVTEKEIRTIQEKLNNRPRKTLGYKTPNEVYEELKLAS